MDKRSHILLIVEGKLTEKRLFEKLFAEYGLMLEYEPYAYETNIHDLYSRMLDHDPNLEAVDLLGTLKEKERDSEKRALLDVDYSDILLVFDYDPHDNRFSPETLARMVAYFCESTDQGKLFVNYPMIESFKHFKSLPDPSFATRTVEVPALNKYKELVDRESFCTDLRLYDRHVFDTIIAQSATKARLLCGERPESVRRGEAFPSVDHESIILAQNQLAARGIVSVLCTCLFFICDYNPNLINWEPTPS